MPEILAISGSLRAASSNTALLKTIAAWSQPPLVIRLYEGLANIPPFNPDLDIEPFPAAVTNLREQVRAADAVIFSTPEYAHGMPGSLKNALDWLVGSGEFYQRRVTLFNASTRGTYAQAELREVLRTMGARYVTEAEITLSLLPLPPARKTSALDKEAELLIRSAITTLALHSVIDTGTEQDKRTRLTRELTKLDPEKEKQLAEEGIGHCWPAF